MQFNQWRVSTKLWCTLGGLLAMMLAVSLWTQHMAAQTMQEGMRSQADMTASRINLAPPMERRDGNHGRARAHQQCDTRRRTDHSDG